MTPHCARGRPALARTLAPAVIAAALAAAVVRPQAATAQPDTATARANAAADSLRTRATARTVADAPSAASAWELLLPTALRTGYLTRAWVRDSLQDAGNALDDLDRVDLIYARALAESGGDIGLALFASLVACFDHHDIPLSIGIHVPLTLEPEEAFRRRVAALPAHLFADAGSRDDRDKLQHFFASAWLAWTLDNAEAADLVGLGVEAGEDLFVAGGVNDPRDVRANRLGQMYVQLLRERPAALPSTIFRAWNRRYVLLLPRR